MWGFKVREPGPHSPSNTRLQANYKCTDAVASTRGWRSLEGPPHRVVRGDVDNGTGAIINQKNLWENFIQLFFFYHKNIKKSHFLL